MGVSKNSGVKPPKMDGENNGKPYEQVDDLGDPYFWKPICNHMYCIHTSTVP